MSFTFTQHKGNVMIIDGELAIWIVLGRDLPQPQLTQTFETTRALFGPSSAQGLGMCLMINASD